MSAAEKEEKMAVEHFDKAPSVHSGTGHSTNELTDHEKEVQKRLVRKLDARLMLWAYVQHKLNLQNR